MEEQAKYLSIHYGKVFNPYCNVHKSNGTQRAKKLHYHDFYQIYFITEGILTHHSQDGSTELVSGDCFIVPPFFRHRISDGKSAPTFYSFSFKKEFLTNNTTNDTLISELLSTLTPQNTQLKISLPSEKIHQLKNLLEYCLEEFLNQENGWQYSVQSLLSYILIMFSRKYSSNSAITYRTDSNVWDCIDYINGHFKEDIKLKDVLEKFHFSHSTFLRAFTANTGKNFSTYLIDCKIEYACALLRETDKPSAIISSECGFYDYSAFYRAFCRRMKVSPNKYRSIAKNQKTN